MLPYRKHGIKLHVSIYGSTYPKSAWVSASFSVPQGSAWAAAIHYLHFRYWGLADVLWAIASAVCCGPDCAVAAVAWMCQQWMPSLFGQHLNAYLLTSLRPSLSPWVLVGNCPALTSFWSMRPFNILNSQTQPGVFGIILDQEFSFSLHINQLIRICYQLCQLRVASHSLPCEACTHPHPCFCNQPIGPLLLDPG